MKIVINTLILLFFMSNLQAKDSQLINELHKKFSHVHYYQANFKQSKQVSYISKPLITKGKLKFALNLGLIWEVTDPLWVKTLIKKSGDVYKSTKYQNRQKVKDLQIKVIAEIMSELLTANLDKIESQFHTKSFDENSNWKIILTPKKMVLKKAIKQIELVGTRKEQEMLGIESIFIIDHGSNMTQIQLSDVVISRTNLTSDVQVEFE